MNDTSKKQHTAWTKGPAADSWFSRNLSKLSEDAALVKSTRFFADHIRPRQRILEIGTANGHQLHKLQKLTGCEAYGVDPSTLAVSDGKIKYPHLNLSVGTADQLQFPDLSFDVVLFGFCLYLVDRSLLMRAVSEADRVLMQGGRLMIVDFDPSIPHRRSFAHQQGLWSYKMRYPDLWLANPEYVLDAKCSYSHEGDRFHTDPGERVAAWVLVKQNTDDAYPEVA